MIIIDIKALQILDSRGNPTLQVKIILEDGSTGSFKVPSGASTGIHEACELRDGNKNIYHGKSVLKAIENIYKIKKDIINIDLTQEQLDRKLIELDGTENKELIGANTILGISIAFAKACAKYHNLPTYEYLSRMINNIAFTNKKNTDLSEIHLFANVINGGLHSGNELNIQEFMIIPLFGNVEDKIRAISETYHVLKDLIDKKYGKSSTAVGDEGGFAPEISKTTDALDLLVEAIEIAKYTGDIAIALDAAASDFYNKDKKVYEPETGLEINSEKLMDYYNNLIGNYPIISIEDPFAEDDFASFAKYMKSKSKLNTINPLNEKKKEILIVGDDLLVTNPQRIKIAQDKNLCNSLLLKINQIGTLSESIEAWNSAKEKKWHIIVSHRSGETCDDFIADLAVALNSSIKIGAPARGERTAKYNRLIEIYNSN